MSEETLESAIKRINHIEYFTPVLAQFNDENCLIAKENNFLYYISLHNSHPLFLVVNADDSIAPMDTFDVISVLNRFSEIADTIATEEMQEIFSTLAFKYEVFRKNQETYLFESTPDIYAHIAFLAVTSKDYKTAIRKYIPVQADKNNLTATTHTSQIRRHQNAKNASVNLAELLAVKVKEIPLLSQESEKPAVFNLLKEEKTPKKRVKRKDSLFKKYYNHQEISTETTETVEEDDLFGDLTATGIKLRGVFPAHTTQIRIHQNDSVNGPDAIAAQKEQTAFVSQESEKSAVLNLLKEEKTPKKRVKRKDSLFKKYYNHQEISTETTETVEEDDLFGDLTATGIKLRGVFPAHTTQIRIHPNASVNGPDAIAAQKEQTSFVSQESEKPAVLNLLKEEKTPKKRTKRKDSLLKKYYNLQGISTEAVETRETVEKDDLFGGLTDTSINLAGKLSPANRQESIIAPEILDQPLSDTQEHFESTETSKILQTPVTEEILEEVIEPKVEKTPFELEMEKYTHEREEYQAGLKSRGLTLSQIRLFMSSYDRKHPKPEDPTPALPQEIQEEKPQITDKEHHIEKISSHKGGIEEVIKRKRGRPPKIKS